MNCPRLVIAGTNSGVGKTSISIALTRALVRRGMRVQTFKVGPDFLDPTYLEQASGRPCYNLDGWMCGEDYVQQLFTAKTANADIAIIEGVMGLYDGASPDHSEGSTAEIARWLQAPVVLLVNAHGMARSLAATVKGFVDFEPELLISCIIANQTGSERHADWVAQSLQSAALPELVGAVPRNTLPELPGRHLGLVTANRETFTASDADAFAIALEQYVAVEKLVTYAGQVPEIDVGEGTQQQKRNEGIEKVRIGIARDKAFHFYYSDFLEALEAQGAELHFFSPIEDPALPADLNGVILGGGYPELYAKALSSNQSMITSIRSFAAKGKPLYAECGGLLYLGRSMETLAGEKVPMLDIFPAATRMLPRKKMLGYVAVTLQRNSLWGKKGDSLRGHEFHYSEIVEVDEERNGWEKSYHLQRRNTAAPEVEGYQRGNVLASYVHLHPTSSPDAIQHFLDRCRQG